MEKATRMASVRTSHGVPEISGVPGDWSATRAMGWGGDKNPADRLRATKTRRGRRFDPAEGFWFASEFGQQFGEPVDDPRTQPLEARPVLVAVGGEHAVDPHGRGRLGIVGRIPEVDDVFRAYS